MGKIKVCVLLKVFNNCKSVNKKCIVKREISNLNKDVLARLIYYKYSSF